MGSCRDAGTEGENNLFTPVRKLQKLLFIPYKKLLEALFNYDGAVK